MQMALIKNDVSGPVTCNLPNSAAANGESCHDANMKRWEMRAQKHPERLQSFLVAVAEQPNYFADVIDELRVEDFEDEKDKTIETRRLTRQQSAEQLVLKCYGDMVSL